jgi:hypothetical protein
VPFWHHPWGGSAVGGREMSDPDGYRFFCLSLRIWLDLHSCGTSHAGAFALRTASQPTAGLVQILASLHGEYGQTRSAVSMASSNRAESGQLDFPPSTVLFIHPHRPAHDSPSVKLCGLFDACVGTLLRPVMLLGLKPSVCLLASPLGLRSGCVLCLTAIRRLHGRPWTRSRICPTPDS